MNPKHYVLNIDPNDGRIWLVLNKPGQHRKRIKEMTNEILWCLCADLSASLDQNNEIKSVERSIRFNDGMACKINVVLTSLPDWAKREALNEKFRKEEADAG